MEDILIYLYDKYSGRWEDIYKAILSQEKVDIQKANKVAEEYRKVYEVITIVSDNYPSCYRKDFYQPPFVLLTAKEEYANGL